MPTKQIALFVGAVVLVVGAVFAYTYTQPTPVTVDYTLEPVRDGTFTGTLPPLDHEVVFSGSMPEEAKGVLVEKVKADQKKLAEVPYDGNTWMDLALYYHSANDFDAARTVWEFIVTVTPTNVTALNNLGRMYHFDLKQFEKAESYFKAAIAANPDRPEAYYELFDLYRYSYKKNTSAAVDIMKDAAKVFPHDSGVFAGLGIYYRERGNSALARTYFEQAISVARTNNDLTQVQNLTQELANLP